MAHDIQNKAAAFALFGAGLGITEVSRTLKIPKGTVQDWNEEWTKQTENSTFEVKRLKFAEAIADFGLATVNMLTAQAVMLSDRQYVVSLKNGTDDAIRHTEFIRDSLITLNASLSLVDAAALPGRTERVEGIPVEE